MTKADTEFWVCEDGSEVRIGPPSCLGTFAPNDPHAGDCWADYLGQQVAALAAHKAKAEAAAGASSQAHGRPLPRSPPLQAGGAPGADRPAKPKGEPGTTPWPPSGAAAAPSVAESDPYMSVDGGAEGFGGPLDGDAAASGTATPVWPPPSASLRELEGWLESLRSLPPDDAIQARVATLEARITELQTPPPAERGSVLTRLLRARQLTEKRRRQLRRFIDMRDGLLEEAAALKSKLDDAHATIEATARLSRLAEEAEYNLFCEYSASLEAPGRFPSPEAATPASAEAARSRGGNPEAAAGVCGLITQLLTLPSASHGNLVDAYTAILSQARLVHASLTGNPGPFLEPVAPAPGAAGSEGGFAPRMAWATGGTSPATPGAAADAPMPAAAGPAQAAAAGLPETFGSYAAPDFVGPGGGDPTPAESVSMGRRSASRSASSRSRPSPVDASRSRAEERERSPKGRLAEALAQAAAEAEAEDASAAAAAAFAEEEAVPTDVSEDPTQEVPPPGDEQCGPAAAAARIAGLREAAFHARTGAAAAAAILRHTLLAEPDGVHAEACRVEAAEAQAAADAADAALAAARAEAAGDGASPFAGASSSSGSSAAGIAAALWPGLGATAPAPPAAAGSGGAAPAAATAAAGSGLVRPERVVPIVKGPPAVRRAASVPAPCPDQPSSPATRRAPAGGDEAVGGEVAARRIFFEKAFSPGAGARPVPGSEGDDDDDDAL